MVVLQHIITSGREDSHSGSVLCPINYPIILFSFLPVSHSTTEIDPIFC